VKEVSLYNNNNNNDKNEIMLFKLRHLNPWQLACSFSSQQLKLFINGKTNISSGMIKNMAVLLLASPKIEETTDA
jgi:carbohydrate-binding DOMON domain-containing protein